MDALCVLGWVVAVSLFALWRRECHRTAVTERGLRRLEVMLTNALLGRV